jgi:hypothetical protein
LCSWGPENEENNIFLSNNGKDAAIEETVWGERRSGKKKSENKMYCRFSPLRPPGPSTLLVYGS